MKANQLTLLSLFFLTIGYGCISTQVVMQITPPNQKIALNASKIVLVDLTNIQARGLVLTKQREEVLKEVKQFYVKEGSQYLSDALHVPVLVDTLQHAVKTQEAIVEKTQEVYGSSMVIILKTFDGGFSQETVDRTTDVNGSVSKTARYEVYCTTDIIVWQNNQFYPKYIHVTKPHSERSVMSGLLARGPGYRANKGDIEEAAKANMVKIADLFR